MLRMAKRVSYQGSRWYETSEGNSYPSVTTILSAIGKPALINWAANTERQLCIDAAADLYDDMPAEGKKISRAGYVSTLQRRIGTTKAHKRELEKASNIGSQAHARIEWTLRKELGQVVGPEPTCSQAALWAYMAWEDWRRTVELKPLHIEQTVWSDTMGYAGTLDLDAEMLHEGKRLRVVIDWKTGKAIYRESLLQNAAYGEALVEMRHAERPLAGMIVRLPKVETDPEFEAKWIPPEEAKTNLETFLAVRKLWVWLQEGEAAYWARKAGAA
jgi:hypothetical protein